MEREYRRLYRSNDDRIIAGVCGGIGDYFTIDPVLVRLIWIALLVMSGGAALIFYLLAWLIIPRNPGMLS